MVESVPLILFPNSFFWQMVSLSRSWREEVREGGAGRGGEGGIGQNDGLNEWQLPGRA